MHSKHGSQALALNPILARHIRHRLGRWFTLPQHILQLLLRLDAAGLLLDPGLDGAVAREAGARRGAAVAQVLREVARGLWRDAVGPAAEAGDFGGRGGGAFLRGG